MTVDDNGTLQGRLSLSNDGANVPWTIFEGEVLLRFNIKRQHCRQTPLELTKLLVTAICDNDAAVNPVHCMESITAIITLLLLNCPCLFN